MWSIMWVEVVEVEWARKRAWSKITLAGEQASAIGLDDGAVTNILLRNRCIPSGVVGLRRSSWP
jgi:hypothetical protein